MNTEDEDGGWDLEPILPFERETPPVPPAPVSTPKNYPIWGHKGLDAGLSLGQSSWRQMTGWLAVLPSPVLPEASPQSAPQTLCTQCLLQGLLTPMVQATTTSVGRCRGWARSLG